MSTPTLYLFPDAWYRGYIDQTLERMASMEVNGTKVDANTLAIAEAKMVSSAFIGTVIDKAAGSEKGDVSFMSSFQDLVEAVTRIADKM